MKGELDSDFVHLDGRCGGENGRCSVLGEQLQSRPPSAAVMHASSNSCSLEGASLAACRHPFSIRRHLKRVPDSNPRISMASFFFPCPFSPFSPSARFLPAQFPIPSARSTGFLPFSTPRVIILRFLVPVSVSSITDHRFSRRRATVGSQARGFARP